MKSTRVRILLAFFLFGAGCSSIHRYETRPPLTPVPVLTEAQLTGLVEPPRLEKDPESGQWAIREVLTAYHALQQAGYSAGWNITIVSGYRSYQSQERLWNRKYRALLKSGETDPEKCSRAVLNYTSVPGFSRHHWGTELDLGEENIRNRVAPPTGIERPRMEDFYAWLDVEAPRFGFCKAYKGVPGAIQEEPWHWTYQRYSSFLQKQFNQIKDFSGLPGDQLEGWTWVRSDLLEIRRLTIDSVAEGCRQIRNMYPEDPK